MKLSIGHLYPELFNLYGDRGNVRCLLKRLQWRGIEAEVIPLAAGEKVDLTDWISSAGEAVPTGGRRWRPGI